MFVCFVGVEWCVLWDILWSDVGRVGKKCVVDVVGWGRGVV